MSEIPSTRATGRTARMLTDALNAARAGGYVLVVASTAAHADDLFRRVQNCHTIGDGAITGSRKMYTANGGEISVVFVSEVNVNWTTMETQAHHSVHTFYDHFTIEDRLCYALDWLHRYDK